jgi:hypothetical protein
MENLKNSITLDKQSIFIKFSVLLNHSSGLIHANLNKIAGKNSMAKSTVEKWCKEFKSDVQRQKVHKEVTELEKIL